MIREETVERVLNIALETGADFAELFAEDCESNRLQMSDGHIEQSITARRHGAGVRVMLNEQSAYAYSADTGEEALIKTAKAAAAALKSENAKRELLFVKKYYKTPQEISFASVTNDKRVALMHRGYAAGKNVLYILNTLKSIIVFL